MRNYIHVAVSLFIMKIHSFSWPFWCLFEGNNSIVASFKNRQRILRYSFLFPNCTCLCMRITTPVHFLFIGRNIAESSPHYLQYLPQNIVDGEISDWYHGSYCNNNSRQVTQLFCCVLFHLLFLILILNCVYRPVA